MTPDFSIVEKSDVAANDSQGRCVATDTNTTHIVAIDDDPMTLFLLTSHLGKAGYKIETAESGASGLDLITESTSVALVDLRMPDLTGFQVIQHLKKHHPTVQVIVLTGSAEISDAVQAMREGAFQFISKPFDPEELVVNVEKAIVAWQVIIENQDLKASHSQDVPVRDMESSGDVHSRLMEQVNQIAKLDATVFIGGETGTGKSTIARMIHQKSKRAKEPFVTVNCASLPRDLIQSELFGHTKGSFTGAVNDRIGHAAVANGGTLFLDEIGDLPIDLQPKLLTFLQDRTIQRLGETKTTRVDVRLIAATHRDLAAMCREGLFRQDLYFRLLVLNLELPGLRFRLGELSGIVISILQMLCERQFIPQKDISVNAMQMLMSHSWPGNIRELENVLERAVAFSSNDTIEPADLLFSDIGLDRRRVTQSAFYDQTDHTAHVQQAEPVHQTVPVDQAALMHPARVVLSAGPGESEVLVPSGDHEANANQYQLAGKTLEQIERDAIVQTLESLGGNKAKTARTLGISEKSIYNKMRRLKIEW